MNIGGLSKKQQCNLPNFAVNALSETNIKGVISPYASQPVDPANNILCYYDPERKDLTNLGESNTNQLDANGYGFIHEAVLSYPFASAFFNTLLEHNADVNLQTRYGKTIAHIIAEKKYLGLEIDYYIGGKSFLEFKIQQFNDINTFLKTHNKPTTLDLTIKNNDGKTPIDILRALYPSEEDCKIINQFTKSVNQPEVPCQKTQLRASEQSPQITSLLNNISTVHARKNALKSLLQLLSKK